jgi:hypothetical protein
MRAALGGVSIAISKVRESQNKVSKELILAGISTEVVPKRRAIIPVKGLSDQRISPSETLHKYLLYNYTILKYPRW